MDRNMSANFEHEVTERQVSDAYEEVRLTPLVWGDDVKPGGGEWRERDRVYALLERLGVTVVKRG